LNWQKYNEDEREEGGEDRYCPNCQQLESKVKIINAIICNSLTVSRLPKETVTAIVFSQIFALNKKISLKYKFGNFFDKHSP